jgi:hypothetical protein
MDKIASAMKPVSSLLKPVESGLNTMFANPYILTAIKIFLCLYAALAAPKLPKAGYELFQNVIFRIIVAFLIILVATRDASLALLMAIAFVVTLYSATRFQLVKSDMSVALPGEMTWLPSAKMTTPIASADEKASEKPAETQQKQEKFATQQTSELLGSATQDSIPGSDATSCPRTWETQHCIQGIETQQPNGFDLKDMYASF